MFCLSLSRVRYLELEEMCLSAAFSVFFSFLIPFFVLESLHSDYHVELICFYGKNRTVMKKQYIAAFLIGLLMPLLSIAQQPTKSSPELQVANGGQVSISSKEFKSAEVIGQAAGNHQALVLGDDFAEGLRARKGQAASSQSAAFPQEGKWNAPGKFFLHRYAQMQQASSAKSSKDRKFLEENFGLRSQSLPGVKSQEDYLSVIIRYNSVSALQEAEALGFLPQTVLTNLCTGLFPLSAVEAITAIEGIEQISVSVRAKLNNDLSRAASKVDEVQSSSAALSTAYDGTGVVVGIVDVGSDYTHPTFFADPDDESSYRVKRVWNQWDNTGTNPEFYAYGSEYASASEILAQEHDSYDGYQATEEHHGTHVAGTAAGSGAGTSYAGMAPGADLVFVSTTLQTADIIDGVSYIQEYAASVGKPSVVNLSLGTDIGPHTGNAYEDQMLNGLSGPGHLIVASAGNSGSSRIHAAQVLPPDGTYYPYGLSGIDMSLPVMLDVYDYANGCDVIVALENPSLGETVSLASYSTTSNGNAVTQYISYQGQTIFTVTGENYYTEEGYANLFLVIEQEAELPEGYVVSVGFKSASDYSTTFHAWLANAEFSDLGIHYFDGDYDYTHNATMSAAEGVLSVAAYTTRTGYEFNLEDICSFSGRGPLVSNVSKPDIAAPGSVIISAGNSFNSLADYDVHSYTSAGEREYPWVYMQGTSMAAPAMTGIAALLLENDNELDINGLRDILQATALTDSYVNEGGVNRWGAGKVDAMAALRMMETGVAPGTEARSVRVRLYLNGTPLALEGVRVRMSFYDPETGILSNQEYRTDAYGMFVFDAYEGVEFSMQVERKDGYAWHWNYAYPDAPVVTADMTDYYVHLSSDWVEMETPLASIEGDAARLQMGDMKTENTVWYPYIASSGWVYGMNFDVGVRYTPDDLAFMGVKEEDTLDCFVVYVNNEENVSIPFRYTLYAGSDRSEVLFDTTGETTAYGVIELKYGKPIDVRKDLWIVVTYANLDGVYPHIFLNSTPVRGRNDLIVLDRSNPALDMPFNSVDGFSGYNMSAYAYLEFSQKGNPMLDRYQVFAQNVETEECGPMLSFDADEDSYLYDSWQSLEPGTYHLGVQAQDKTGVPMGIVYSNQLEKESEARLYTLSINQNPGGQVSVIRVNEYGDSLYLVDGDDLAYGETLVLKSEPEYGMRLSSWMDGETASIRSFQITGDVTVEASFEEVPTYLLTIKESLGGVVEVMDVMTYEYLRSGERYTERDIVLMAYPDYGYALKSWSFQDAPESTVYLHLDRDMSISAEFVEQPMQGEDCVVHLMQNSGGTLNVWYGDYPVSNGSSYKAGSLLRLEAVADPMYEADTWWDGTPVTSANRSFVLEGDVELSVTFSRIAVKLDIAHSEGGSIRAESDGLSVASGDWLPVGAQVKLSAMAAEGYTFESWWDGETNPERVLTMDEDMAISAVFVKTMYRLSIPESEEGIITVSHYGNGEIYEDGDEVEPGTVLWLNASAQPGSYFVSWWDGDRTNPRIYPVLGDLTVSAVFREAEECEVAVEQTEGGLIEVYADGILVEESGRYWEGTLFNMYAYPEEGYQFVEWWNGYIYPDYYGYELTSDVTVSARFIPIADPSVNYTLTIEQPEHGTIYALYDGSYVYSGDALPSNAVVNILVVPDEGYAFSQWWDGNTQGDRNIILTEDVTVSVEIVEQLPEYLLTIYQSEGGRISASLDGEDVPTGSYVAEGSVLDLLAEAEDGYQLAEWWDGDTEAERTLEMTRNTVVRAVFAQIEANQYKVDIVQPEHGVITVTCNGKEVRSGQYLDEKSELWLVAEADSAYEFGRWWDGDTNARRTYVLIEDVKISATIIEEGSQLLDEFEVTIKQNDGGYVRVYDGDESIYSGDKVEEGTRLRLVAEPDRGYVLDEWWNGERDEEIRYTVNRDVEIKAYFVRESANEMAAELLVSVWPNPSDGLFYVEVGSAMKAQVFTSDGRLLQTYHWEDAGKQEVDLQGRNSGTYYLHLIKDKQHRVIKLVVR